MRIKFVTRKFFGIFFALFLAACTNPSENEANDAEFAAIFLMLSQTQELHIHQMRGAVENEVYLSADGHQEAVYDGRGNLVLDGINDGSYNYAHPEKDPFGHYSKDIHPWILYGNSRTDPTTKKERIFAYMGDIETGIIKAREIWPETSVKTMVGQNELNQIPKEWIKILADSKNNKLVDLIHGNLELTDETLISCLTAINQSFEEIYQANTSSD